MIAVLTATTLLGAAACGGSSGTATQSGSGAGPSSSAAAGADGGIPALTGDPTDTSTEATISAGGGTPPDGLRTVDIVAGTGATAAQSSTVDVRYTGALYSDGTVFDASWKGGDEPISFPLSGVVPGFAQGIVGMQEGGRREIVIPPALGYGAAGNGPVPGGATIVFVVDLVTVS